MTVEQSALARNSAADLQEIGETLLIYGKNERADLTADERKSVAAFAAAIKATRKRK